jgi:hypothetical protein
LLLHDNNVYTTTTTNNVIKIRDQTVTSLNELQWQNAHQNVYFPPSLGDEQIQKLLISPRGNESVVSFSRFERTGEACSLFAETDKDEYVALTEGVTSELAFFCRKALQRDVRIKGVSIRAKPRFYDDGSIRYPQRDPVWCRIIMDFLSAVKTHKCFPSDLFTFVSQHGLEAQIGPWINRVDDAIAKLEARECHGKPDVR